MKSLTELEINRGFVLALVKLYGPEIMTYMLAHAIDDIIQEPTVIRAGHYLFSCMNVAHVIVGGDIQHGHPLTDNEWCWTKEKTEWPVRCPCGRVIWDCRP